MLRIRRPRVWAYSLWWASEWDSARDEPGAVAVSLGGTDSIDVALTLQASWTCIGERYYGPGMIVILDEEGCRVGPAMPTRQRRRKVRV